MSSWLVDKTTAVLEARTSRRSFLVKAAVAGAALTVSPLKYLLRPVTAYAAICGCNGYDCGCGAACCDGYTAFCCEVNDGKNACPAGSFPGGWWRADGSMFCDGTRYIVDCNLSCDADWPGCGCAQGDCNRRGSACNWFRYGQCSQHIECYGPILCRMATCEPPYMLDLGCTAETFWDNSTANHSADCSVATAPAPRAPAAAGEGEGGGEDQRDADRAERARQRDEERAAREAERDAERAQRDAERASRGNNSGDEG